MFPDLYAFVIRLCAERGGPLPAALGHQVQALFLELVRQIDPELANALHADALSKPFTAASLGVVSQRSTSTLDLRITLLRTDLFAPFTRALLEQTTYPALRLGTTALVITEVWGTPGSHRWAGYSTYADLATNAQALSHVTLTFATPTAFGQGTLADGRKRLGLLPVPETVFGSIARRWNELAPPTLTIDLTRVEVACTETLLSRHAIETQQITLGKGPQKGFVGTCTYELPPDPDQRRLLTLLADAAFYLGIGMKTARGMGQCRRVEG